MDDLDTTQEESQEQELSHSDKMIGVFTEPTATFAKTAQFPHKTVDWFLPVIIMLVIIVLSRILVMGNEEIAYQAKQKMRENITKALEPRVASGQMTQEQADQAIEAQVAGATGTTGMIIQSVAVPIFGFIVFFIMSGIYLLFAKFVLKGDGGYSSAMVANGLISYIAMIQFILVALLSLLMGKLLADISVASFMDSDRTTIVGFILAKLDVIQIWGTAVLGIGLAKMFKSDNVKKYIITVFAIWILGSLLFFVLVKFVPFLKSFGM